MPSAPPVTAVLNALTISLTLLFSEPVHWYEQPSSLHASSAPYFVGTKNGLVVTWLTKTNFRLPFDPKMPAAGGPRPPRLVVVGVGRRRLAAPAARRDDGRGETGAGAGQRRAARHRTPARCRRLLLLAIGPLQALDRFVGELGLVVRPRCLPFPDRSAALGGGGA